MQRLEQAAPAGSRRVGREASGQVLVLFALSVVVFLGMAALVVDFGSWLQDRRTYQNAADAAALVGGNAVVALASEGSPLAAVESASEIAGSDGRS